MYKKTKHTIKDYILAVRPWSFPASSMTAVVSFFYIFYVSKAGIQFLEVHWNYGLLAIIGAVLAQAAGNLISDYYDFKKGVDIKETEGTTRMLIDEVFEPKSFLKAGCFLLGIVSLIGIYLMFNIGLELLWIGLFGIFCAGFYFWFKYRALGDLTVFLIYGPVIAVGTAYSMTGAFIINTLYISLPISFLVVNILHANNTHDIKNDKRAGIKTIPMLIGFDLSKKIYIINALMAYILIIVMIIIKILPLWSIIVLITFIIAWKNISKIKKVSTNKEDIFSGLDAMSAQLVMIFDFSLVVSLIIASL